MAKIFKKNLKIFLLLIVAFAFKIFLSQFGNINNGDIAVHLDWSQTMFKYGFGHYYFRSGWSTTPPTQPPLINFLFYISQVIYNKKYVLSQLHNLIKIPPSFFILWFDQYGQYVTLKLWPILTDILSGFLIYKFVKKYKNSKIALIASAFFLFNPITIFESSIWGQNDIVATLFATLSFVILKDHFILSPILFASSLLIKPTTAILIPIYIATYIKMHPNYKKPISAFFITLTLSFLSFLPFCQNDTSYLGNIINIIQNRIAPSSKGITRASVSAFNLYSTLFTIDKTPGYQKILSFITVDSMSLLFYISINFLIIKKIIKKSRFNHDVYIYIFLLVQSTFIFTSSMLERYFLPGIIASTILIFISDNKKIKILIMGQYLIHFSNLLYAFNYRHVHLIKLIFQSHNFFLIRILSLLNVLITLSLFKKLLYEKTRY